MRDVSQQTVSATILTILHEEHTLDLTIMLSIGQREPQWTSFYNKIAISLTLYTVNFERS